MAAIWIASKDFEALPKISSWLETFRTISRHASAASAAGWMLECVGARRGGVVIGLSHSVMPNAQRTLRTAKLR